MVHRLAQLPTSWLCKISAYALQCCCSLANTATLFSALQTTLKDNVVSADTSASTLSSHSLNVLTRRILMVPIVVSKCILRSCL